MRKTRRKHRPKPLQPKTLELSYFRAIRAVNKLAWTLVKERVLPLLPELVADNDAISGRTDAKLTPQQKLTRLMDRVSLAAYRALPNDRLEAISRTIAKAVSEFQKRQLARQLGQELGIAVDRGINDRIRRFVGENVSLIKSQPQAIFDDVEKNIINGMRAGLRHEEIADNLIERAGVSESRAALIARDQVLKFNGELNQVRQKNLGISKYVWNTVGDERVREEHAARDGQIFSWDDPPGDPSDPADAGHPGDSINCRCFAEPILPDEESEED